MIQKLLVANRAEIAIRAFRAATELGISTVAVYAWEDRNSTHREKADESYLLGEEGRPVRSYLDVDAIMEIVRRSGADAVYPGYGFLSENPELADACAEAGVVFVGPPARVLRLAGNKVRAVDAAVEAGLATLRRTTPRTDPQALVAEAGDLELPLFVKAVAGGGGRGMRRVDHAGQLGDLAGAAMREAEAAFGDGTAYLEEAVIRPRHVEVQVLADATGDVVHLFERDCSLQRRHQKIIEQAPAPGLDAEVRARMCEDAVRYARHLGYVGAGTVEFLVDRSGRHVFIEMNPRIQVEHTITEEITDVDLVVAQLRIARGETLADLGLRQETIRANGVAIQCRITTEDPLDGFRPDTGRLSVYRPPGGAGVRLDGDAFVGAEISPYYDSLLVKLTVRGRDSTTAVARMRRCLAEFRIRGVSTNIPFLQAVLAEADLTDGSVDTGFVEDRLATLAIRPTADRATRLLEYLADVTVNRPHGTAPVGLDPSARLPSTGPTTPPPGSKQRLDQMGPSAWAQDLRRADALAVCDTTFRDAHQSILATRLRTHDLAEAAPHVSRLLPQLLSLECWGGATYDVALSFLREDPWARLARLREAVPNICLQMLLRGRNTVGYSAYPDEVCEAFVEEAAATGIDIFRIFDALNNLEPMLPAIRAVVAAGRVAEGTLCYTGDLLAPDEDVYTLDHYLRLADGLVEAGAHVLAIKDMAGVLKPPAAALLVASLRERFDVPVRLHTHDTAGGQIATYLAAIGAGVDAVDGAIGPLAGMTSQPPIAAIAAATADTIRATGLSLDALADLEPYWEGVRALYRPFESGLAAPTASVYRHQIPGGQLSNLRQQAVAVGLGDRFEEIERRYIEADRLLGNIIKVTPTSKVVGDLALWLASAGVDVEELEADPASGDLPASVLGFLRGELGTPPGGWNEPFRSDALAGRQASASPPVTLTDEDRALLATAGADRRRALDRLLFPGPAAELAASLERHGDVSVIPSRLFWYGLEHGREEAIDVAPGVRILFSLQAIGEADDNGMRSVMARLNGRTRPIEIFDRSVEVTKVRHRAADPTDPSHVPAPFNGVVAVLVADGDEVGAGDVVAVVEAMKLETSITAQHPGTVSLAIACGPVAVSAGDLIMEIRP